MIVTVGDLVTDVLAVLHAELAPGSDTPATVTVAGGGQAANTAAWLASEGFAVTFVGAVGDDQAGRDRLAELRASGVRTQVGVRPGVTTGSVIVLVHGDERTMISDRGANRLLDAADVEAALRAGARHLHLSGYPLLDEESRAAGLRALELARAAGMTTSVDAASAAPLRAVAGAFLDWVSGVDILLANDSEAAVLTGTDDPDRQAGRLAEATGCAVVVKLGSGGALWASGGRLWRKAADPVLMVDATGAGDAFAAGLLGAWTAGADAEAALRAGCRLGARAVGTVGARPVHIQ